MVPLQHQGKVQLTTFTSENAGYILSSWDINETAEWNMLPGDIPHLTSGRLAQDRLG